MPFPLLTSLRFPDAEIIRSTLVFDIPAAGCKLEAVLLNIKVVNITRWSLALAGLMTGLAGWSDAAAPEREIGKLYAAQCANCHGKDLRGGMASSLFDNVWRFGADDQSIARAIRDGYPDQGMEAFKAMLSEAEIRAMVVYLREQAAQFARATTKYATPVDNQLVTSHEHKFRLEQVAEGLATPWSVAFLPEGGMLVTELPGTLRLVEHGQVNVPMTGTPRVRAQGQGGLMDVKLHPGYASNGWIYLTFSHAATNAETTNGGMTSVVRGRLRDRQWVDEQVIFRAPAWTYRSTEIHFGSRLTFDGAGHLFFSIGERGSQEHAQDLTRPNGKIHRVMEDGAIPADNPFVGQEGACRSIWSYGQRNPQGLVWDAATGRLWETEHGPRGGDELNLIRKGANYGWPRITYGINYNGTPITDRTEMPGMEQPIIHWTPSIAVCAVEIYQGDKFPRWKNNLFVTALAQEELRRLVLAGDRVVEQEVIFKNIGRVRDVVAGPDGLLYVVLNKPDRVVRLVPAND